MIPTVGLSDFPPNTSRQLRSPGIPRAGVSFALVSSSLALRSGRAALADFDPWITVRTSGDHHSPQMVGHCCFHKRRIDRQDYL
jgi:hypothetical protein